MRKGSRESLHAFVVAAVLGCGFLPAGVGCGAATDAQNRAGGAQEPPSCRAASGRQSCGPAAQSCCDGPLVPGGMFYRSYDGVSALYASQAYPATVSGFRLDRYEITVGRFRSFVAAVVNGWLPQPGTGKHVHLNGGKGLSGAPGAAFETGWDATWNANLATTPADWNTNLQCFPGSQTWTPSPGANELLPIGCITWFEAYAFCIWDGGFLPSEAEWNYAAAGGSEQRAYPWSQPAQSMTIDCSHANYINVAPCVSPPLGAANAVGSESPAGDGKWGQADLAGNVWEWVLDFYGDYGSSSSNGADLSPSSFRVVRGGAFDYHEPNLAASFRYDFDPTTRNSDQGARCARVPL